MRIFLTGATGFIGSKLVPELLGAGHEVLGMTRSQAGADTLAALGAQAHLATLEEPDAIRAGAEQADAVIHCAFDHDFGNFVANCEKDGRVVTALGAALKGSDRPLLITSGTGMGDPGDGGPAREDIFNLEHPNPRRISELTGAELLQAGINVSVMRLPQVHDTHRQGLVTPFIAAAREKGVVGYVGDGANRWPAGHVGDVVRLYRLAIERAEAGARYHAVGEDGVRARDIAEVLGRVLDLPVRSIPAAEAQAHFGWLGMFMGLDMQASNALTRAKLGWTPAGPGLLADLERLELPVG